jgi:hypothetical protein
MRLHNWLSLAPDGRPWMVFLDTCRSVIEQIPALVADPAKPEDILNGTAAHFADSVRALVSSRPIPPKVQREEPPPQFSGESVINAAMAAARRRRRG